MTDRKPCQKCGTELPSDTTHSVCADCQPSPSPALQILATTADGAPIPQDDVAAQETLVVHREPIPVSDPQDLKIGSYELTREIARGGMGVVFQGRDGVLRRDVAIKILLEKVQGNQELKQRFIEEARIAGQLQHPGVTPIYELGVCPDERPYFAMKLVQGETFAKLLADRPDPKQDRHRFLKIFELVCQTLAYAHSHGVIHRDLKPANIMVGAFGEVQVMDWGLAKVLQTANSTGASDANGKPATGKDDEDDSDLQTKFGSVLGTLAYMPPEQAMGDVTQIDQRSDVFGLGAILCEILTGRPPYVGNLRELRRKAFRGDLKDALNRLEQCDADEELVGMARRSLAREPADRPSDASILAGELTAYLAGVETRLHQSELAEARAKTRAIEESHRRRLTLLFSGAVLAVLAIGIIGTVFGLVRAGRARESLRRDLYVADLQLANQMWESGNGSAKNVVDLLNGHLPEGGQADLREFAWRLQWTSINRSSLVLKGHDGGATLAAFTPDSNLLTLDKELNLRRWKLPMGTADKPSTLQGFDRYSIWTASSDASRIALGFGEQVRIYDLATSDSIRTLVGRGLALGLGFSRDGSLLAVAWGDGRVQICDVTSGEFKSEFQVQQSERISRLKRIYLAPDGERVFLAGYPEYGQTTCLSSHGEVLSPVQHESSVHSIAMSRDGRIGATGDFNGLVCLWNGSDQAALGAPLRIHRGEVSVLEYSPDGTRMATGADDGLITVWDVTGREQTHSLKGHQGRIHFLQFSPDGTGLASASDDGSVRVWNLRPEASSRVLGIHELPVFSMAFSPRGDRIAIGSGSGSSLPGGFVKIWTYPTGELVSHFHAAEGRVLSLAFVPNPLGADSEQVVTAGYDSSLHIWDTKTSREIREIRGDVPDSPRHLRHAAIGSLAISPDGKLVAAGFGHPTFHQSDYEQVAKVWELATGTEVKTLSGHTNTVCSVTFSPDGRLLATASDDQRVRIWSTRTWEVIATLRGTERFKSVAFSPNGQTVAAGGENGAVTIWDSRGGAPLKQLSGHANAVQQLMFSPDGRTLATASWDNTIKLWETTSKRETRTLRGHGDWISCLAFTPDGNTLATGSFDASVRLWESASKDQIEQIIAEDRSQHERAESKRRQRLLERSHRTIHPMAANELSKYAGTYGNGLIIKAESDHLTIRPIEGEGGVALRLYPQSTTDFFSRDREVDVRFLKDENGTAISVLIFRNQKPQEARRTTGPLQYGPKVQ